jgi:hypothetical protein
LIPVEGPLRLAFIHDPMLTPEPVLKAMADLNGSNEIQVVPLARSPREGLHVVAQEGYELIHLVADGDVTLSYEGELYFHGGSIREGERRLSGQELTSFLAGGRVGLLSLTADQFGNPDQVRIGNRMVRSVFRAFAQLASQDLPLPNIVAPLGPVAPDRLQQFWREFYLTLAGTHHVERALAQGRPGGSPVPMALFLRHPQGVVFRRLTAERSTKQPAPIAMQAELEIARGLMGRLKALAGEGGSLPESAAAFLQEQPARNQELDSQLESWRRLEEDEWGTV